MGTNTIMAASSSSFSWRRKLQSIFLPMQLIICGSIFVNDNSLEILAISGASMQPTLSPNYRVDGTRDYVYFNKWKPLRHLQRGDVVFFNAPHKPDTLSVKRVVALAGDTVLLDTKRRPDDVLNGAVNEAARKWDVVFQRANGRVVVPEGHVWVEGDNWRSSNDSNAYGPISRSLILGTATCLVWPLGEFGKRPWETWTGRRTKVVAAKDGMNMDTEGEWWQSH